MIRMVLFALGFVAITVALVVVQPGLNRRGPETGYSEKVTRATPALSTEAETYAEPPAQAGIPAIAVPVQAPAQSREPVVPPAQVQAQVRPTYGAADGLDDQAMRRMTWDTLSSLNHATGRDSAPGQPGSLLHTIVRRSLDGTPAAQSGASAQSQPGGFYVVKEGDSLVSIAHDIYGDVNMTGPLFAANQSILSRPDDLSPGQTLVLPKP